VYCVVVATPQGDVVEIREVLAPLDVEIGTTSIKAMAASAPTNFRSFIVLFLLPAPSSV
jgi:hypothetical protein